MLEKDLVITNTSGLHARPASVFVNATTKFDSEIVIEYQGRRANAKSIMYVMALGVKKGEPFKLLIKGQDEKEAMAALTEVVESKLGAEELME